MEGASKSYVLSVNSLECGKRWHPDPLSSGVYTVQVLLSAPLRPSERGAGGGVLRRAFIRCLYRYCRRRLCVPAKGVQAAVARSEFNEAVAGAYAAGVTKASGLEALRTVLKVAPEDTVAVGDGHGSEDALGLVRSVIATFKSAKKNIQKHRKTVKNLE